MRALAFAMLLGCRTVAEPVRELGPDASGWQGTWHIRWTRPDGWRPPQFTGPLELRLHERGWSASVDFAETTGQLDMTDVSIGRESARTTFKAPSGDTFQMELLRDGERVRGLAQWVSAKGPVAIPWSVVEGTRAVDAGVLIDPRIEVPWSPAAPAEVGLDEAAVREIAAHVRSLSYSGFVLIKDDRLVALSGFEPSLPAHVASVSKAVSSLAVPFLIAEGRWPSVDAPIGDVLGWPSSDPRHGITLAQVLLHARKGASVQQPRRGADVGGGGPGRRDAAR